MNLLMDAALASGYTSNAQKIRVITEAWAQQNIYCMHCGSDRLEKYENNKPVADFYCPNCKNQYELKGHAGPFGRKIVDGAYDTMMSRITSNDNPDLFGMEYDRTNFHVNNFFMIPKYFFTPDIIEQRKPLALTARRAGWVGCNILLAEVPNNGCIYLVQDGKEVDRWEVLDKVRRSKCFEERDITVRGWMMDILRCVDKIKETEFQLSNMYEFEDELYAKHRENHHIRAKIRQQLQMLRDRGYIEFLDRGRYRKRS